jgi:hypothetical protein
LPVYWTPVGFADPVLEYFHKYVVTATLEDARIPGSRDVETYYTYKGAAAWHYDDNELVRPKLRTWGQWRGYEEVDTRMGEADISDHPQLLTRTRYFRGMHGDRLNAEGGSRSIQVDGINDLDQYAGMEREAITFSRSSVVERTRSTPWRSSATATDSRGKSAYYTGLQKTETITTAPDLAAGTRIVVTDTEFDEYGMPEAVSERGDTATTGDETCTRTWRRTSWTPCGGSTRSGCGATRPPAALMTWWQTSGTRTTAVRSATCRRRVWSRRSRTSRRTAPEVRRTWTSSAPRTTPTGRR